MDSSGDFCVRVGITHDIVVMIVIVIDGVNKWVKVDQINGTERVEVSNERQR